MPVGSPTIEKGTLVLRDGRIEALGADVKAPADAKVIDGSGLTLYPALIDASTKIGIPAELPTPSYSIPTVRAENQAAALFKPDAAAAKNWRAAGFGVALTTPQSGLFAGTGALVSLADGDASSLLLRQSTGMRLDLFSFDNAGASYPGSLMGRIAAARQALTDARYFSTQLSAYENNPVGKSRPQVHRALQALQPVIEQKMPLIARASSSNEISRTLRFSKEFSLSPVIDGGAESWAQADALKAAGASVLLSAALPEPPKREPGEPVRDSLTSLRKRALAPTSAVALVKAGVPFALTTSGMANPADLSKNVRKMIAAGLTEEQAIAALTQTPAKLLGVERQLGTLAPGKLGYVLAVEGGSLFGPKAKPRFLFIDGKRFPLSGPSAVAGAKPSVIPQLPPGISKEQALAFLKANPEQAAAFLPPGVTIAQAIAELEGKNTPADTKPAGDKPAEDEKIAAPPAVTPGPVFPVPASIGDAYVLRGATIWPGDGKPFTGDLYIKGGKIAGVGAKLSVPAGTKEINAQGKHIAPGIIDCHSHSAVEGSVNEGSNIVTSECRIADVLDATDISIYRQLAGGVTAANVLHGSANAIGGQNAVLKWRWGVSEPTDLLYANAPQGVKFALGENPTGSNSGGGGRRAARYPSSRLGVERVIRSKFIEARDYNRKRKAGEPIRQDFQLDAIVEILEGKRLVHCHSYRADEILMMVRLAEEFGFKVATFQHVLEGYKVTNELAAHGAGGSTFSDWWAYKIEAYEAIPQNAALMTQRGVLSSINSDDDEQARRLNHEAAKSMRYGLSEVEALAMVTINPARQLKIDKYTGSLAVGKDADFAVWSGSPLSSQAVCEKTFVEGVLRFDLDTDKAARTANSAEKTRLLTALEPPKKDEKKPADPVVPAPEKFTLKTGGAATGTNERITGGTVALVGGTVHTVSGTVIPKGTVIVQNGVITAVGETGKVKVPGGATVVKCDGKHLWPGMIDANATAGISEIGSRRETQDDNEQGEFAPELRASVAIYPDAETIMVGRTDGVLSELVAPSGGTISGEGTLLNLNGWTVEEMGGKQAAGLWLNWPAFSTGGRRFGKEEEAEHAHRCEEDMRAGRFTQVQPPVVTRVPGPGGAAPAAPSSGDKAIEEALKNLNEFWEQAQRYAVAKAARPDTPVDPKFEAMLPYLTASKPLFIRANSEKQIRIAVLWAKKAGQRIIIVGGDEADRCAELLAKEKVPVILGKTCSLPGEEDAAYDDSYTLPARLAKAGVQFCLSSGGSSADLRHLPFQAAMASAFGMSKEDAVKAMTLWPAQILGYSLGALEAGKQGNVLITDGDILEQRTRVLVAYVRGNAVDLTNKQTRLYDRWKSRPK